MTVVQQGQLNTTALIVPGMYVQIVPPAVAQINGLPTNILGAVGTAQWGPVNAPTVIGSMLQYAQAFGSIQNRLYDMGTAVAAAVLQGANNFRCVRVTDGTDVAATATLNSGSVLSATLGGTLTGYTTGATCSFAAPPAGGVQATGVVNGTGTLTSITITNPGAGYVSAPAVTITAVGAGSGATATSALATAGPALTAKYTGSLGNTLVATLSAGSQASTQKVVLGLPGQVPEVFDNIGAGLSGNALWVAVAAAINSGISGLRGPSNFATAVAGSGTGLPAVGTTGQSQTFTGGTDGAGSITPSMLVGVDTSPRKGMYALRNTQASVAMLADVSDSTTFSTQVAFGLSEGIYMIGTSPSSDTIANAVATKASAGIDSYAFKYMFGDWPYYLDTVNGVTRLISPQGFVAGRMANQAPQQSSLNQPIYGIVGTQRSYANLNYSSAELQQLIQAGIDVIATPSPGGNFFSCQSGHNSSSNSTVYGDNYTRMTNYIAYTLNAGMGQYVGRLQSSRADDPLRRQAKASQDNFFVNMRAQGQIDDFLNQCDVSNNPPSRVAQGYLQMDTTVRYLSVVEKFLINLQGGQSVQITRQATTLAS